MKRPELKLDINLPDVKDIKKATIKVASISGLVLGLVISASVYFQHYRWNYQSPILVSFQTPLIVTKIETQEVVEITPEASIVEAKEVEPRDERKFFVKNGETIGDSAIAKADNKWILWRVYALESSRGNNDGCKYMGKFNGFGYRQNSFEHICFDEFEEVVGYVDAWFNKQLETKTLEQTLCLYNQGKLMDSCEYSNKFMSL